MFQPKQISILQKMLKCTCKSHCGNFVFNYTRNGLHLIVFIYNKFVKNNKSWLTHSFQLSGKALKSISEMEPSTSTSTTAVPQRVKQLHNKKSFLKVCNRQKKGIWKHYEKRIRQMS